MFFLDISRIFLLFGLHGVANTCRCNERSTVHIHCSCEICEGKAVSVSTAWRHGINNLVFYWIIAGNFELIIPIKYHCWKNITRSTNDHPMIFQDWEFILNQSVILLEDYWYFPKNQ